MVQLIEFPQRRQRHPDNPDCSICLLPQACHPANGSAQNGGYLRVQLAIQHGSRSAVKPTECMTVRARARRGRSLLPPPVRGIRVMCGACGSRPGPFITCGSAFWRTAGRLFLAMVLSPWALPLASGFLTLNASLRPASGSALLEVGEA